MQKTKLLYRVCRTCTGALTTLHFKKGLPGKAKRTLCGLLFTAPDAQKGVRSWEYTKQIHLSEMHRASERNAQENQIPTKQEETAQQFPPQWWVRLCKRFYYEPSLYVFTIFTVKFSFKCKFLEGKKLSDFSLSNYGQEWQAKVIH